MGCSKLASGLADDLDSVGEAAHQLGADVDESFTGSGSLSSRADSLIEELSGVRTSCLLVPFTCTSGVATRTFGGCTIGRKAYVRTGDVIVTLKKSDESGTCVISEAATILRQPNFAITRSTTGTLTVTSADVTAYDTTATFGSGQKLTKVSAGNYTWDTLGINRTFTNTVGTEVFNMSFKTSTALTITGTSRATRKITAGTWEVYHNIAKYTASLAFDNVAWEAGCNEPTSGTVTGTLTGSQSGTFTLTFGACGTSTLVYTETGKEAASTSVESDSSSED